MSVGIACPHCGTPESRVINVRPTPDNRYRRRRRCASCSERFTTYEGLDAGCHEIVNITALSAEDRAMVRYLVERLAEMLRAGKVGI